jgi:hypothetical protein
MLTFLKKVGVHRNIIWAHFSFFSDVANAAADVKQLSQR